MTAAGIAAALGPAYRSGAWWRCRCPAHGSNGATLAVEDGERGLLLKCFAGCDPRNVLAELRRLGLIGDGTRDSVRRPVPLSRNDGDDAGRRTALAQAIWKAAKTAHGTPVVDHFAGRGIILPLPLSLRYAPSLRRPDGTRGPAIVARIDNIDREVIGISRTWLERDEAGRWNRRDRAMLGRAGGGAVRLAPAAETLLIGEGIETCLAAMQAMGQPAWAALSTSGMVALVLPPIVRTVIILADHDRNGAGERAARAVAQRWLAEGRRVRIAMPPEPGTDFNDVLVGRAYGRVTEACDVAA
jgi:putative DNA primase/helicase